MTKPATWGRAALLSAALAISVNGCDSVLGIEEPKPRPGEAGEAGEPPIGGAAGTKPIGGSSGTSAMGGAAGEPNPSELGGAGSGGDGSGGDGGEPPMTDCSPGAGRCTAKAPEVCDESGHWVANDSEAEGDCPVLCSSGKCVDCATGDTRCSVCTDDGAGGESGDGRPDCDPNQPQKCVAGFWQDDGDRCANLCNGGGCDTPTSCFSATSRGTCSDDGGSCCESLYVPGGMFKRNYDEEVSSDTNFPAAVSPFFLDRLEVTVGRMKQFVAAYPNIHLREGEGKSDHIDNDQGWRTDYEMPADSTALVAALKCAGTSWSDSEDNVRFAVNCVPFNVAYAFCIWDGGRLPTDAELNFAQAGGNEQRTYVWGDTNLSPDHGYFSEADRLTPNSVGSWPKGDGRWGHADLSGNVSEWVLDYYSYDLPDELCDDCLAAAPSDNRAYRGNAFTADAENQYVAYRGGTSETDSTLGFRCARDWKL